MTKRETKRGRRRERRGRARGEEEEQEQEEEEEGLRRQRRGRGIEDKPRSSSPRHRLHHTLRAPEEPREGVPEERKRERKER